MIAAAAYFEFGLTKLVRFGRLGVAQAGGVPSFESVEDGTLFDAIFDAI
jgi:hypothetical protein